MKQARNWLAPVGAALAALWLHWGDLYAPFFADDWLFLDATRNRSLGEALTAADPIGNFSRPLARQFWFWVLDRAGGGDAFVFHAANLALFVGAVLLLGALAMREAGPRAAAIACAGFALTSAADVPLRWASGSQDLLALVFALLALLLADRRPVWGALALLAALLSKETVLLTPFVALALVRRGERDWAGAARRTWPMFAALAIWAISAGSRGFAHTFSAGAASSSAGAASVFAALLAFARSWTGVEWANGAMPYVLPGAAILVAAAAALVLVPGHAPRESGAKPARAPATFGAGAWPAGLVWVLAGALPVAAVAAIWSSYYFLFAIAGASFALGALLARVPAWAGALVVLALGSGSAYARGITGFAPAPDAWSAVSHVNRHYVTDGAGQSLGLLFEMRRLHPTLPSGTTVFFSGLPAWVAFQAGDGPLLRVAYRDSSLRSHYLADMNLERARRGPWRIVAYDPATQRLSDTSGDPLTLANVALSMMVRDRLDAMDAALVIARDRGQLTSNAEYVEAFRLWERGDHAGSSARLRELGFEPGTDAGELRTEAMRQVTLGDTARAAAMMTGARARFALDPHVHGILADVWLPSEGSRGSAVLEAYAARALAPEFSYSWRRWASVQILYGHPAEAVLSLKRYFALAPEARAQDPEAVEWLERLSRNGGAGLP
ncbi:MAG: hypothetical protein IT348_01645 [Candidatus Eisenbacteria bacterium]|nr:hypothetical protein [Candidatus Eisenbacteria bacterium]